MDEKLMFSNDNNGTLFTTDPIPVHFIFFQICQIKNPLTQLYHVRKIMYDKNYNIVFISEK